MPDARRLSDKVNSVLRVLQGVLLSEYLYLVRQPQVGQGPLIHEISKSHTTTRQSVGFLWTSHQSVAETSTWQHTTLTTNIHAPGGFEPTISAGERPQTLDRAASGTGDGRVLDPFNNCCTEIILTLSNYTTKDLAMSSSIPYLNKWYNCTWHKGCSELRSGYSNGDLTACNSRCQPLDTVQCLYIYIAYGTIRRFGSCLYSCMKAISSC